MSQKVYFLIYTLYWKSEVVFNRNSEEVRYLKEL